MISKAVSGCCMVSVMDSRVENDVHPESKHPEDSLLSAMERVGSEETENDKDIPKERKTIVKGLNGNSYTKDGKIINGTQYNVKLGFQKNRNTTLSHRN